MQAIQDQVNALADSWKTVFEALEPNPQVAAPHLDTISIEQISEVIGTLTELLGRVRSPAGFNPGFHVAKAVASTALATTNTSLAQLRQGQYGHFPAFILGLNQAVTALYTCVLRSESQDLGDQVDRQLVEKLALLNTAQTELGNKLNQLRAADELLANIQEGHDKIAKINTQATEKLEEIETLKEGSKETCESIEEYETKYNQLATDSSSALLRIKELEKDLKLKKTELEQIEAETKKQQELITALLPNAASAGLASAFSVRVREMKTSKRFWLFGFGFAIGTLLILGGLTIWETYSASDINILLLLARRLPLAAPLIWLGWFSAVQYGNSLRVQEDYAFKEATSKAFEGYRDHMEHLKGIEIGEAESALTLLSKSTIEILSREPLRVFKGTHRDATPANAVHDMISRQ